MMGWKLVAWVAALASSAAVAADGVPAAAPAAAQRQSIAVDLNTCPKPAWPKESLRMEHQGAVKLAFLIDADGSVLKTDIVESSGHVLLDVAAAEGLAKCRFTRGAANGDRAPAWVKLQYVWTLKDAAPTAASVVADLRQRAEAGQADAQQRLGMLYLNGDGVERNRTTGTAWMRRAAEQGHVAAQEKLAMLLAVPGPGGAFVISPEVVTWMSKAAEGGSASAQFMYGRTLMRGEGVPADVQAGVAWLTKAASAGHAPAQGALGYYLVKAHPQRSAEALAWLERGSAANDALASFVLADLHAEGKFVGRDDKRALALYSKAAQAGSRPALLKLADRFEQGVGVPADPAKARMLREAANKTRD